MRMVASHKTLPTPRKQSPQKTNPLTEGVIKTLEQEFTKKNFSYVEKQCVELISQNPQAFFLYNILGLAQLEQGQYQSALDNFNHTLQFTSGNVNIYQNIANAALQLGDTTQAAEAYKKIIEITPKNVKALISLAVIYFNQERYQAGLEVCFEAFSIEPTNPSISKVLSETLKRLGDDKLAQLVLGKVIEKNENSPSLHYCMGEFLKSDKQFGNAIKSFEKATTLQPDYYQAHLSLGHIYYLNCEFQNSLDTYVNAIEAGTDSFFALSKFSQVLKKCHILNNLEQYQNYIIDCLDHPDIDGLLVSDHASRLVIEQLKKLKLSHLLSYDGLQYISKDKLVISLFQRTIVTNPDLEYIFSRIRHTIIELYVNGHFSDIEQSEIIDLSKALAMQSFLNEYIWFISDQEKVLISELRENFINKIDNSTDVPLVDIVILSMYEPLHRDEKISSWIKKVPDETINKGEIFYKKLFLEPILEKEISLNIKQYTSIDDDVSRAVQTQYEENPYPRWDSVTRVTPENYTAKILAEVYPNTPRLDSNVKNPEILIAGCGTGRQPIYTALECISPNILAVDLSKASLSYAIRKANELSIKNIEFGHADILKLEELGRTFDLVESCGVLHHMEEPEKGLKVLLNILRPRGFLKLGLYSEIARKHVVDIKEQLDSNNAQMTTEEIRSLRKLIEKDNPEIHQKLCGIRDYFASSTFRDLILHVQEHRFTIPQLKRIINENNLEFMGFVLLNPATKKEYLENYPDDQNCINLDNWHEFEKNNPNTFLSMYQFWCQKL